MITISKIGYDLYDLLKAVGFQESYRRFIVAQAAHESDNFSSDIFVQNNNPFGMKYQGQGTALGEKNGYAYYTNMGGAVQDYKRLFKSYGFVSLSTLGSFVKFLQNQGYYTAKYEDYLNGCNWFYNLYFPNGWTEQKTSGAGGSL